MKLTSIEGDEELNDIGEFDSASFPTISILDTDDDVIGENELN